MSGDNGVIEKMIRDYNRLIISILSENPMEVIIAQKEALENTSHIKYDLDKVLKDARKYILHYQSGRTVPVLKTSPLGQILEGDAFRKGMHAAELMNHLRNEQYYPRPEVKEEINNDEELHNKSMQELVS